MVLKHVHVLLINKLRRTFLGCLPSILLVGQNHWLVSSLRWSEPLACQLSWLVRTTGLSVLLIGYNHWLVSSLRWSEPLACQLSWLVRTTGLSVLYVGQNHWLVSSLRWSEPLACRIRHLSMSPCEPRPRVVHLY